MRYIVCYVEEPEKDSDILEVKRDSFEDFAAAVEKYTLLCGCTLCSVVLADAETGKIIKQYYKDDVTGSVIIS
ncbi:hypothetical protein [Ruminococcus sp. HUN007]|uniref:hypothetical protein n=1 Tax=Ruminococcus sp. HUN007 TaxID=1514668 RepID=UPI0005D237CF|nr:hypothetical protein [Ruminococcus sp. HUN007]